MPYLTSTALNTGVAALKVDTIINRVAKPWLFIVCDNLMRVGKEYAPDFNKNLHKFSVSVNSGTNGVTYCTGPYVHTTAWDLIFTVPEGGFKYGDIDPVTGEPFPGGINDRGGTYVSLIDKPETEGEGVKHRARTYSRLGGMTQFRRGFFDEAIRQVFGTSLIPSALGSKYLQMLANDIALEYAWAAGLIMKRTARQLGMTAYTQGPGLITKM